MHNIYTVYVHAIQRIGAVRLLYCSAGGKILKYFIKHLFFIIIFLSLCSVSVKTHVKEKKDEDDRRAGEHEQASAMVKLGFFVDEYQPSRSRLGLFFLNTHKMTAVLSHVSVCFLNMDKMTAAFSHAAPHAGPSLLPSKRRHRNVVRVTAKPPKIRPPRGFPPRLPSQIHHHGQLLGDQ